MLNVQRGAMQPHAAVLMTILEILMLSANQNVLSMQNALDTCHALTKSVETRVLEYVGPMQAVMLPTICLSVNVIQDTQEMLLWHVAELQLCLQEYQRRRLIHVNLLHVGKMHNVIQGKMQLPAHVFQNILEILTLHVDQNVQQMLNVHQKEHVRIINVLILVLIFVGVMQTVESSTMWPPVHADKDMLVTHSGHAILYLQVSTSVIIIDFFTPINIHSCSTNRAS
jgi:hypothetical protein